MPASRSAPCGHAGRSLGKRPQALLERLAPLSEDAAHQPLESGGIRYLDLRRPERQPNQGRGHLRRRAKGARRQREQPRDRRFPLHQHAQHAVVRRAWLRPRCDRPLLFAASASRPRWDSCVCSSSSRNRMGDETLYGKIARDAKKGSDAFLPSSYWKRHTTPSSVQNVGVDQRHVRRKARRRAARSGRGRSRSAVRRATRGASLSVRAPAPGPISRKTSSREGAMAVTTLSAQAGSRKC